MMAAMSETAEQRAMWAATVAVRRILARSKDRRTLLGQMKPTSVAYHAAWAAIRAHKESLEAEPRKPSVSTF